MHDINLCYFICNCMLDLLITNSICAAFWCIFQLHQSLHTFIGKLSLEEGNHGTSISDFHNKIILRIHLQSVFKKVQEVILVNLWNLMDQQFITFVLISGLLQVRDLGIL